MIFDFRLQVFYTVARRLSFTKAADELYITQPAVTKHIRGLEQQLNTKLFDRRGNSIALTETGKILLRYCKQLSSIYTEMEQEISAATGTLKGTLHIGASLTIGQYILPSILAAFRTKHNDTQLSIISGNTEVIEQALLAGTIEIGLIEGHTRNKQIKYTSFLEDEIVLAGRKDHPLSKKKSLSISDLQQISFVMREYGSGTLEVVNIALKKAGLKLPELKTEIQLDSTEGIKSYLLHSDCLSFISAYAIQDKDSGSLFRTFPVKGLQIKRPLNIIHLHGEPSRLANAFKQFMLHYNKK